MANEPDPTRTLLIEEEMKDSYLNYAMSVIISRALPDVRDGLKPSQRRVLVAMNDLGLGPRAKFRKSAKICGDTTGNYHPHGEQVVYPTLVRLAQEWVMRYPLVDGQGNFGSVDGDPPAAMRYTEARMTAFTEMLMEDLDKNTVDMRPNYDETREEPSVLPGRFPNLLANGSSGIAVGMATSIPPHNLGEVCDAVAALIAKPDLTVAELMQHIKGPDFPTGGIICGLGGIREAYETGKGLLTVRGRVAVEEKKGDRKDLIITEIPYNLNKASLIEKIAELVKEERIAGIADVRDESDKDGMRIVVELKRGEEPQLILNQLYSMTPLQDTCSVIMIALVNNRPQTLNLKDLLTAYRDHRKEVIRRRTRHLLEKAEAEAHILEGILIALGHIDEVIQVIKASESPAAAQAALVERFALTVVQAQAILDMRLQRLTGLEQDKVRKDLHALREKIAEYKAILADEGLVLDIIREDCFEMKEKYADPRRTEIVATEAEKFEAEDLIAEEEQVIVLSHEGYIKRVPLTGYRKQKRGGKGVIGADTKEGDFIERLFIASTHDHLLFFTRTGKVHWLKVYDLPELPRTARGKSLVNLLEIPQGDAVASVFPVRSFETGFLVMATRRGLIKKTELAAYGNPKRGGIIALSLEEGDALIGVQVTGGQNEIVLGTEKGLSIRFPESQLRPMGRPAYGVTGLRLQEGDAVRDMLVVNPEATILTVCEKGFGKRSAFDAYRRQSRGGKGIINIKAGDRNGPVIALKAVRETDDVILITAKGIVIRSPVADIRVMGRAAQGVRLITIEEGDKLVAVTNVSHEEEPEAVQVAPPTAEAPAPEGDGEAEEGEGAEEAGEEKGGTEEPETK
jgi:DNA gyrase subunit A